MYFVFNSEKLIIIIATYFDLKLYSFFVYSFQNKINLKFY